MGLQKGRGFILADRKEYRRRKRNQKQGKKWIIPVVAGAIVLLAAAGVLAWWLLRVKTTPQDAAEQYFSLLNEGKYEEMYQLLSEDSKSGISQEDFVERNQNIYEGIEAKNIQITVQGEPGYKEGNKNAVISYSTAMDTLADEITFDNKMNLMKEGKEYRIVWDSTLIFPSLQDGYKVQINTQTAKRGAILDRNGQMLAGQGTVSEVGIVPGKLGEQKEESVKKIAEILGMSEDSINEKLNASYVQEASFVPVKEIAKNDPAEEELLKIQGIMINDKEERVYPLGAAAGHLTGYIQAVTAEDLEELSEKG